MTFRIFISILSLAFIVTSCEQAQKPVVATKSNTAKAQLSSSNADPDFDKCEKVDLGDGYTFGSILRNGHVDARGTFHNGVKDGAWATYHNRVQDFGPNIEVVASYKDGVKHGPEFILDAAGRIKTFTFWVDGKKQGPSSKYQHTSTVDEVNYKNDLMHGLKKMYYQDGVLQMESTYIDGKRDGIERYYDEDGKVVFESTFKDGVKQE